MKEEPLDDPLRAALGSDAAEALVHWAKMTTRVLRVPAQQWRRAGYTKAVLARLFITEKGRRARLVVVKRLPPGQTREPEAHRRAMQESPVAFRPHLVEQAFDPIPLPDGGALMFQALAGDGDAWRPMASLATARLADACAVLTRSLITEWNNETDVEPRDVVAFLRDEVAGFDSGDGLTVNGLGRSAWMRTDDGDDPFPDPRHLLTDTSLLAGAEVDLLFGRVHGDLHDFNVLIEQGQEPALDTFVLVDLMTYRNDAQLGRDLVKLLLSVVSHLLPALSPTEQRSLLRAFVRPGGAAVHDLPVMVVNTLRSVYDTAATAFASAGAETWRRQYLLSLIAHGLVFTTYVNLGPTVRWWFYRLAGYAAGEVLPEFDRSPSAPTDVEVRRNPFAVDPPAAEMLSNAVHDTATEPSAGTPRSAGDPAPDASIASGSSAPDQPRYSPAQKHAVCRRLSRDWADLADRLGIDQRERALFGQGRKAYEIWEWLEDQGRLGDLAPALRDLGLSDVAAILDRREV